MKRSASCPLWKMRVLEVDVAETGRFEALQEHQERTQRCRTPVHAREEMQAFGDHGAQAEVYGLQN